MSLKSFTYRIIGSGKMPFLVTHIDHIGTFVARIIADPRTLNQAVMVWEDQVTQFDTQDIGARISGDGDKMKELYVNVSCCCCGCPHAFDLLG